jgi:hypothetical protein
VKLPHRRQFLHLTAGAAALPAVSRVAWAQTYPTRPVRLIMCFPSARDAWRADKGTMQKIADQWRLSHLSAADFGASNSV